MTRKKIVTTDEWVRKLNALARETDSLAVSIHPSVWHEQLKDLGIQYRNLARANTRDEVQLVMDL